MVTAVLSPIADTRPQCNTIRLLDKLFTLEYIRFGEICRPVLRNQLSRSNDEGIINFPDFFVERGPEGTYILSYISGEAASEHEITAVSSAANSISVNTQPPQFIQLGVNIDP